MTAPVDVLKAALDAIGKGDFATFATLLHPETVLEASGNSQLGGKYNGPEKVMGFFTKVGQLSDGTFSIDTASTFGDDSRAVGVYKMSATRNGQKFEWDHVNVYDIRDDKIANVRWHIHQQAEFDKFWS